MLRVTIADCKKKRPVRFRGIGEFAAQQGVHRIHVYLVLTGQRQSKRLVSAWKNFKRAA